MTTRPILFSGPMVRALLRGTKSQTRRVVKPQPVDPYTGRDLAAGARPESLPRCPYGAPGDGLWVRETWAKAGEQGDRIEYRADTADPTAGPWRPSIHMPRWASRLTLRVTSVRVERLQAISEEDAEAEGVLRAYRDVPPAMGGGIQPWEWPGSERWHTNPVDAYREGWESINGPGSWAANPWVWVVGLAVSVELHRGWPTHTAMDVSPVAP